MQETFRFQPLADIQAADQHHAAKIAYLEAMDKFLAQGRNPRPQSRKTAEQLISPVERILLAHMMIEEQISALIAILDAPTLLPAHRAQALRNARQIAEASQQAISFFDLVKDRCRHKEDYGRKRGGR